VPLTLPSPEARSSALRGTRPAAPDDARAVRDVARTALRCLVALIPATLGIACSPDGERAMTRPILREAGMGAGEETIRGDFRCNTDLEFRFLADGGVPRGGIPAMGTEGLPPPVFAPVGSEGLDFMRDHDRVAGFFVDGQPYAVSHNILWWHEIVNFATGGRELAITFCPITGTVLGFDRASIEGHALQVSGLLFKANLVIVDVGRGIENESLYPQMLGRSACTKTDGTGVLGREIARFPTIETTWARWQELHPNTLAVTDDTGILRNFQRNPYGVRYSALENGEFLGFPMPRHRDEFPATERLVGLPARAGERAIAFPFPHLSEQSGPVALAEFTWLGEPGVVLWDERGPGGAAYRLRTIEGLEVRLSVAPGSRSFVDEETGSLFDETGTAIEGPLEGSFLEPVPYAYTSFWGSWTAFFPQTEVWRHDPG